MIGLVVQGISHQRTSIFLSKDGPHKLFGIICEEGGLLAFECLLKDGKGDNDDGEIEE